MKFFHPYSDVRGGQRSVAKVLGIAQPNVSRHSNIEISPLKGERKRKQRNDTFEATHPELVPVITNHWVG